MYLISENKTCCYVYGSTHIFKPSIKLLECAGKRIDYVLIEGFKIFSLPKFPDMIIYLILLPSLVLYLIILFILTRSRGHKTDMAEVEAFFRKHGVEVELADLDARTVFNKLSTFSKIVISLLFTTVMISQFALFYILDAGVLEKISIYQILGFLVTGSALTFFLFMEFTMEIRDNVVIEKAIELCSKRSVLIIRGKKHLPYIVGKLKEHDIFCIDLAEICREN